MVATAGAKDLVVSPETDEAAAENEPNVRDNHAMSAGGDVPVVKELQASLFPICAKAGYLSELLQTSLKSAHYELNAEVRIQRSLARLRDPRDLFSLTKEPCTHQVARWPIECQVVEDSVEHIPFSPATPEDYYVPTGRELQPRPVGEEAGTVIYEYNPTTAVSYFSRSLAGGTRVDPEPLVQNQDDRTLQFESRFESGNLAKYITMGPDWETNIKKTHQSPASKVTECANLSDDLFANHVMVVKITDTYYELYLRTDLYTNRHMQWFYFQIKNTRASTLYRISIVNLTKPESLYSCGMRPLMYSCRLADAKRIGWHRIGDNIAYFRNDLQGDDEDGPYSWYTLTFNLQFPYDKDTVYLSHCYPYTYSALQDYLLALQNHPIKSSFTKLRLLCRSLAGNNVYYLTITEPSSDENKKRKPAVVVTARVHPGETPASYMMKGLIDFLTGNSEPARELRHKFIFKLIPMLNPDGVIVGNNRCSLTGRDLNRQYRTVIRETYPPVWHTKVLLRRLTEDCGIALYCDLHAHSRRHNVFIYGCESRRPADKPLHEQVFPLMMRKNTPDKFCFESCKFRVQRSKEGTGRVVIWAMGVPNSYTLEASFGGSTLGSRSDTHFTAADYESVGRTFCETLLDFCDDEPSKERLRAKIIDRLLKEGSSADEPTNINLSDYSSDEGDTSSCSDEEDDDQVEPKDDQDAWGDNQEATGLSNANQSDSHNLTRQARRTNGLDRLSPLRHSLRVPCATFDVPDDAPGGSPCARQEDDAFLSSRPTLRRHRSREWTRRTTRSPVREVKDANGRQHMPPELIITQAQVYEASVEVTEAVISNESASLPCITRRPSSSARPAECATSDRQRSGSWHQMRSIPVYRAYYESHRVLVQRQALADRMSTPASPTFGSMWGLPRPQAKLQRQRSRTKGDVVSKPSEGDPTMPPEVSQRTTKARHKSKFKKGSILSVAICRAKPKSGEAPKTGSGSPVKTARAAQQPIEAKSTARSANKRKNKKLVTRVLSTDF